jgi:anthranilate phosphoribosyltransferase
VAAPLLPVLALLLQRLGVPVIIHGAFETTGGMAVSSVLRELGVLPCATRAQAEAQCAAGNVVLLPLTLVAPVMAAMMAQKARLGVETPAHILASLLMPVSEGAVQAVACTSSGIDRVDMIATEAFALLRTEGEGVFGAAGGEIAWREHEAQSWQPLFAADNAFTDTRSSQPRAVAEWTKGILSGKQTMPVAVAHLLSGLLLVSGYARDIHEAKAIAAVEAGTLAAA